MKREKSKTSFDEQIEENLRKVYQRTLDEEIPDRFMDLLEKLKEQDAQNDRS